MGAELVHNYVEVNSVLGVDLERIGLDVQTYVADPANFDNEADS